MKGMLRVMVTALALCPLGCSFYYSSESSAKSCTSPSRSSASSSDSSGEDEKKEAYRNDVRDFTAAWAGRHDGRESDFAAARQGDWDGFEAGLSEVARRHGVTDWEADDATYAAIGDGLRRARVGEDAIARYATRLGVTGTRAALLRSATAS
jgi:hypothetical protein